MKTLVIGYGNSLRGDDGSGPFVAEQVAAWNLPAVRSCSVHQLTPELAAEISEVEQVFFIDAFIRTEEQLQASIQIVTAEAEERRLDHLWSPKVLLQLAKTLYGAEPIAYQILIPAAQFNYGTPLSTVAYNGASRAIGMIANYLKNQRTRLDPLSISGTA
jgi:hydrogenase maturation protease